VICKSKSKKILTGEVETDEGYQVDLGFRNVVDSGELIKEVNSMKNCLLQEAKFFRSLFQP